MRWIIRASFSRSGYEKIQALHIKYWSGRRDTFANIESFKKADFPTEIQGRKTAKWNTGHGLIKFVAKGYACIDLEWGMGLEGYLTGGQLQGKPAVVFQNPVCIYKVLSLETKISDSTVFGE